MPWTLRLKKIMPHPTARWRTRPSARPTSKRNDVWRRTSSLLEVGSGGWMRKAYYNHVSFDPVRIYVHVQILDYLYEYYIKFTYMHIMIIDYFIRVWTWTLHIYSFFMIHIINILVHLPKKHLLVDSCLFICFQSTSKFSLDKTGRSDSCGFPLSWVTKLPWKLNDPPICCLLSSLAQRNLGSTTSFDPKTRSHSGLRKKILRIFTAECLAMFFLKNAFLCFLMDVWYFSMAFLMETHGVVCCFEGKQIRKTHDTQLGFVCVCICWFVGSFLWWDVHISTTERDLYW